MKIIWGISVALSTFLLAGCNDFTDKIHDIKSVKGVESEKISNDYSSNFLNLRNWKYNRVNTGKGIIDNFNHKNGLVSFSYSFVPFEKNIRLLYSRKAETTNNEKDLSMSFSEPYPHLYFSQEKNIEPGKEESLKTLFLISYLNLNQSVLIRTSEGIESKLTLYSTKNPNELNVYKLYSDNKEGFKNLKRTEYFRFLKDDNWDLSIRVDELNGVNGDSLKDIWDVLKTHPDYIKDFESREGDFKYNNF